MYISARSSTDKGPFEISVTREGANKGTVRTFKTKSGLRRYLQRIADNLAGKENVDLSCAVQGWTGFPWRIRPQRKAR